MNKLKKIWKYLSGKKTTIGMVIMLIGQGVQAFLPQIMTSEQTSFIISIGAVIGGVGVIHKGTKSKTLADIKTKLKGK